MHETSRGFHHSQPASRWRPFPWLANPGNPAMGPYVEGRKIGTHHTDKTVERGGTTGEGEQPLRRIPTLKKTLTLNENADLTPRLLQHLMVQEHAEFMAHAHN